LPSVDPRLSLPRHLSRRSWGTALGLAVLLLGAASGMGRQLATAVAMPGDAGHVDGAAWGGRQLTRTSTGSSVEAEQTRWNPRTGVVLNDLSASGEKALQLRTTGSTTAKLYGSSGSQFIMRVAGDNCDGAPRMTVTVDDKLVFETLVRSSAWSDLEEPTPWPGGEHLVKVAFANDHVTSTCDRNLRLDVLTVRAATVQPPTRLFGLSSSGPDLGIPTAQATSASVARHLDVVNFYMAWVWGTSLPVGQLGEIASRGGLPEVTWEPWDPRQGVDQSAYSLAAIAGGSYDDYIRRWASEAAAYAQPLLLRFGHEMNGTWYPWSPAANGGSSASYVAAYRHVHDLFAAAGADNVSWVWSPNVVQGMPTALIDVYPGSAYVDVIGVDGYNGGEDVPSMGGWRTPQQVFEPTLQALRHIAPTTPVIINETGSSERGGDKAAWIRQLFTYLINTHVTGVIWFDFNVLGRADWRMAASPKNVEAARSALKTW